MSTNNTRVIDRANAITTRDRGIKKYQAEGTGVIEYGVLD